jgi:hypothetical protein
VQQEEGRPVGRSALGVADVQGAGIDLGDAVE